MIIEKNGKTYLLTASGELGNTCDTLEEVICTCSDCFLKKDCPYAFDDYNVNGDCLADK